MRIALVVDGTRGDVQPMLVLGAALGAGGHDVLLCGPPDFRSATEAGGIAFHPVGVDVREYLTANAHAIDGRAHTILRESVRYTRASARAQFETIPDATAGADCIIGAGVQLAGASAAELHGVPYRYVSYCPGILPSREHAPFTLPAQSLPEWANQAAWKATRGFFLAVVRPWVNAHRRALGLAPVKDVVEHLLTGQIIVAADRALAPLPADVPFSARQVPALLPDPGDPLPAKLEAFLAEGPPPVYFGFGSMTDADPARTTRALLDAIASTGARALVSRGWANLGGIALPEGVIEIDAVCHARLFPRVAAVVHHGGAGTTTTAARAGAPQIVIPHVLDQFYWGRRVQLLGLGPPPIPRKLLDASRLASALAATLDNEALAERAREIGERLRADAAIGNALTALSLPS